MKRMGVAVASLTWLYCRNRPPQAFHSFSFVMARGSVMVCAACRWCRSVIGRLRKRRRSEDRRAGGRAAAAASACWWLVIGSREMG